ncbi:MAG: hypothetical protein RJA07_1272 [Bacteroidota bacterium]|jgi:uncharacterized membrane protein
MKIKKNISYSILLLAAIVIVTNSCIKHKSEAPITTVSNSSTVGFCDTITFAKHISPIINLCSGCHSSSPRHFITDYASLKSEVTNGFITINSANHHVMGNGKDMSSVSYADLSSQQNEYIKCWIDNGMKNN